MNRTRRFIAALAAVLASVTVAPGASADGSIPGGLRGLLRTRSADTAGRGVFEAGIFPSVHVIDDSLDSYHLFSVTPLQMSYGVAREMELAVAVPVRTWSVHGGLASRTEPSRLVGFGDLVASAKLLVPLPASRFRVGMHAIGSFPTGSGSRGMSSESTDLELGGSVTVDLSTLERFVPTRVHADVGYRWNRNELHGVGLAPLDDMAAGGFWPPAYPAVPRGGDPNFNDVFPWRLGVEFSTRRLNLFTEFAVDDYHNVPAKDWLDNPVILTGGALVRLRNGMGFKGAVDISFQNDTPPPTLPILPPWRFTLGVTWRRGFALGDRDQDGIGDKKDQCPEAAEDLDGYQDEDGCPDADNDGDGVPDVRDLAPDLAEDLDGFEDGDGRPDLDNDGDGVGDADDRCPNDAEDYDGDRDADGCPEDVAPGTPAPDPGPEPPRL